MDKSENNEAPAQEILPNKEMNGFVWSFIIGSTFIPGLNFSAKTPHLRLYSDRYLQA
jgi:hypothetical protein